MENIVEQLQKMNDKLVRVEFKDLSMNAIVAYHQDEEDGDEIYLTNNLGGRSTLDEVLNMGGCISFNISE
jgi:hypothetical protein